MPLPRRLDDLLAEAEVLADRGGPEETAASRGQQAAVLEDQRTPHESDPDTAAQSTLDTTRLHPARLPFRLTSCSCTPVTLCRRATTSHLPPFRTALALYPHP